MESPSLVGQCWPALNTKCLLPSCPTKLGWISERSKISARKKLASHHAVRVRSEKSEGGFDIDRRRLLLSSSTLGLSTLAAGKALSDPFPAPDRCQNPPICLPECANALSGCCPPSSSNKISMEFQFPTDLSMRTRVPAHLVDDAYIAKYDRAIMAMKVLPMEDPRSFMNQANVHCAYCNGAYFVGEQNYSIHKSWFFAPWHRWYLYFFERILAKLINDDTFALPFWNWDDQAGMSIPPMFTSSPSLYDENRDPCHQPPKILNLKEAKSCDNGNVEENYWQIYTHMKKNPTNAVLFHGGILRYGDKHYKPSAGALEMCPHNLVHDWTGSSNNINRENMGSLYSAGRDPIFYSHHTNVDRMWEIWNSVLEGRNFQHPDLLNSEFLFYDENQQLVKVKAGDCYDIKNLRYEYQKMDPMDLPWLNCVSTFKQKARKLKAKPPVEKFPKSPNQLTELNAPVSVQVERQKRTSEEKEKAEEVLSVEGIELDASQNSKFAIFINLPDADASTSPATLHYAGSFVNLSHGNHEMKSGTSTNRMLSYKVGITEALEDIGATEDKIIIVTLVPQASKFLPKNPIKFTSVKITYSYK